MSDLNPTEIYRRYKRNEIEKVLAIDYLKSIIESSGDEELRVRSVELLGEMDLKAGDIYEFFEQLLTSDLNENVRIQTAKLIVTNYLDLGEQLLKWLFKHEQSVDCLLEIQKALLLNINRKKDELLSIFETVFNNRFPDFNYWKREEMGIGQAERLIGNIQPYLFDEIFYGDLDTVALDRLFYEIVEIVKIRHLSKEKIVKIMQLMSARYLMEAVAIHDWEEIKLSYLKALESSEYGLRYIAKDRQLLWNLGVACYNLEISDKGINAFERLYKIDKRLENKEYKELKNIKRLTGSIEISLEATSLDYLILFYKNNGFTKKEKRAKYLKRKKRLKIEKLFTNN